MRVEIGVKGSVKTKLVSSTRVGHVERMGSEKLEKRSDAQTIERKWRRGRPKLRCEIAFIAT